jgi:hypothetical protein
MNLGTIEGNPKFINTREFRRSSLFFKRHGRFTDAPIGTKDWYDFWEEEEKRCINGYKVGGVKITGRHYFYMNFTQLRKIEEGKKGAKIATKDWDFPAFWELDYDWFWYKEIAWYGCTHSQLIKLNLWRNPVANKTEDRGENLLFIPTELEKRTYGGAKHLSCAKARRGGFSFKEGADGVYNYHLIEGSKSYYFAAIEEYLTNDGILNKVEFDLEFLNQNTDGWFYKNRMQSSTLMNQKASYKDNKGNVKGTQSEIIGVIVNKPDKVRGKEGNKMTFEEGGSFPNLDRAVGILVPSVKEGATLTGQMSVFGTGGEEKGAYVESLQRIHENPDLYDMLAFVNDWEEGVEAGECGVFVPHYMVNPSFMDLDGNVQKAEAIKYDDSLINKYKAANQQKKLDQHLAEFPSIPAHAFMRPSSNNFPLAAIKLQETFVRSSKRIQGALTYGVLTNTAEKGLVFELKSRKDIVVLDYYPHQNSDDLTGCVTVVEHPQVALIQVETPDNRVIEKMATPEDVYEIYVDPYYKDDAADKTSLGVAVVYKLKSKYFSDITDKEVAWFVGRPNKTDDFYQAVLDLADYYNAKIQSEIAGGGKGLFDFAKTRKKLSRLHFELIDINAVEIHTQKKNRNYFMDLQDDDKRLLIIYLADWLKTPVGLDENGNEIWNLHYIYDLGYLQELLKFNDTGNFDRLSARLVAQAMLKQRKAVHKGKQKEKEKKSIIGTRMLFTNPDQVNSGMRILNGEAII